MAAVNFRKINVDQYDDDALVPESLYAPDPRGPAQALADARDKDRTVRSLLQRGDVAQALKEVTRDGEWPYGDDSVPETAQAKAAALESVLAILNSTRSTDIPALVQALDPAEQVTLMKYLYKAMENLGDTSGNVVLGWHEKLTEVAGIGCIVRVMSDRRRV
ncbi:hypothetical protein JCM3770_002684 [Rhodotorula araucariae]